MKVNFPYVFVETAVSDAIKEEIIANVQDATHSELSSIQKQHDYLKQYTIPHLTMQKQALENKLQKATNRLCELKAHTHDRLVLAIDKIKSLQAIINEKDHIITIKNVKITG